MMSPALRKTSLLAHILASVGWFGAVAAFLALALAGLSGTDELRVRAAYVAMEMITWSVIVPLCFASLLTGLVSSLGTHWGLVRHYWVLVKLVLTVVATVILLVHTRPIEQLATAAAGAALASSDLRAVQAQLVFDAGAALGVLLVNTLLAVVKPKGMTRYGWEKQQAGRAAHSTAA